MRMRDKSKTGPNPASPPPSHTIEAAEVVERLRGWRRKLQEVGGYENGLVGIPAEGVRKTIDDCEQAADLLEHQAAEIARLRKVLGSIANTYDDSWRVGCQERHIGDLARAALDT